MIKDLERESKFTDQTTASIELGTEPLWTVGEVAKYLKLTPETIRTMARQGELPGLKLGKRLWRFKPSEIKEWLYLKQIVHPENRMKT